MPAVFSKNGILSGRLDYFCLICSEKFTTEDAALAHIIDVIHKENLKACGYVEKYKKDYIRKAKGIYFCEPCGLTFPTAPKVDLHIDEESHLDQRKKMNPLNRVKNEIIAFNQFIISNDAWNGCVEDTCVLCSTEFDESASHKISQSHVLNLIKSEVIFDESNNTIYRTIDDRSKQCITCNVVIGNDTASHFATAEHTEAYKLYDPTIQQDETENITQTPTETHNGKPNYGETGKSKAIKVVNGDINKQADKIAMKDVNIDNDKNDKKDSKKESSNPLDKAKVKQKPKRSAKKGNAEELDKIYCKNLGAKNYVTSNGEVGDRWCVLCEWLLEESTEVHIRSKHHQELLKLHNERIAENNKSSSKDEETIPYESVETYQKSNVNIDLINETAFCKKCSKNIGFNTTAIDKHIKEHKKTPNKKSPETLSSGIKSNGTDKTTLYTKPVLLSKDKCSRKKNVSIADYAKQHGFSHNVADCSYYCHPCCRRLNPSLNDLQKHVASKIHTENTTQSSKNDISKAPVKELLFSFIKSFEMVDTMIQGCIILINDKYWLNAFNFFLIARKNERIFCIGCHIDLTHDNVLEHIIVTDYHRQIIEKCLLITSLENEFIREIKLDVYHCGYCNRTENDWEDILDHLATEEHKREKGKAEESLRQHQPNLFNRYNTQDVAHMINQFALRNP